MFFTSLVGVVVLLGGLIFFHEFGHYIIAKLFGIKVEVFSLGFGKKIFSKTIGETQYCISLFPLGGYVKLMGDDPYKGVPAAEADRAFSTQKLYKRFLVVAAGPIFNLLLAYVLFMVVFWSGQPVVGNKIGTVSVGSPAWEAGLRANDRISAIDGTKIENWNQLETSLKKREGEKIELQVERAGGELRIPITVAKVRARNAFGEEEDVGGIKGIGPAPLDSVIGISDPTSPGYVAGLRTGDLITKIDSHPIDTYEHINEALATYTKTEQPITITFKRKAVVEAKDAPEQSVSVLLPKNLKQASAFGPAESLGFYPSDLFVKQVTPESPAEKGGLQAGDRIVKVGENPVYTFDSIVEQVQASGNNQENVAMTLEREGKSVILNLKPIQTTQEDPLTRQSYKKFMVGFAPNTVYQEPELVSFKIRDPIRLIPHAIHETNDLAKKMVVSLVKLAMGQISVKNLGGPVLIASVAGKSLDAGIIPFLQMMALISINLFLLNLFPVPVLDGGHLLFFTIEAIKGKPVSIKTMEIANQVGMVFILMLVGLTLFNDISRIILH